MPDMVTGEYVSLTGTQEKQQAEEKRFKQLVGRYIPFAVFALIFFIVSEIILVVLPYEILIKPLWLVVTLCVLTVYLVISIVFSFFMAWKTHPGSPTKRTGIPTCYYCKTYKPPNAHHCRVCDTCIVNMDHHCVFIGSCVGAQNHRYFIQFLGFLTVSSFLFVIFTWRTFYNNSLDYILGSGLNFFCNKPELSYIPWRDTLCYSNTAVFIVVSMVFFLFLELSVFAGALFWHNFSMISYGTYYIEYLRNGKTLSWQMWLWPFDAPNFNKKWTNLLGLHFGRRFWSHILLPSTHKTFIYEESTYALCNV